MQKNQTSQLLNPSPFVATYERFLGHDPNKLYRGSIINVDRATFACSVLPDDFRRYPIPARINFSYCNTNDRSGILFFPKENSKVIYQEVIEQGSVYAWIISFCSENMIGPDFDKSGIIQNPGFEGYGNPLLKSFSELIPEDNGFEPGDLLFKCSKGNKLKVMEDGSTMLKSTPYDLIYLSPIDHRFYQVYQNSMIRSVGSYYGDFNVVSSKEESESSFHYAIERHVVNPSQQQLAFQEEYGLVDKTLRASAGRFDDVPNKDLVKSTALYASQKDTTLQSTLSGFSVYKRKLFNLGGRGLEQTPEAINDEFFCEEIKADGSLRLRVGKKVNSATKAPTGVELFYHSGGTWEVGSRYGKISVTETDMILSTSTFEVSLNELCKAILTHTHLASGTPTSPAMTQPVPDGINTSYAPIKSKIPSENLIWNT